VSDNSFFTYRTDTNGILGDKLGKGYTVVQNEQMYKILDQLPDARVETCGLLKDGTVAFMVMDLGADIKVGTELVKLYATGWNSHNGTISLQYSLTPTRVVCWNTLNAALGNTKWQVKIKHTQNWEPRAEEAMSVIQMVRSGQIELEAAYNHMRSNRVTSDSQVLDYIGNLFLTKKERTELRAAPTPWR